MQLVAGDGRLELADRGVHCGDVIEVLVAGRWVPCRVEYDKAVGWYGLIQQQPGDGGTMRVLLRIGTVARWPEGW